MNFKTKTAAAGILAVLTVAAAAFVILPRHKKLPAPAAVQADKVLVKKAERKLYLQKIRSCQTADKMSEIQIQSPFKTTGAVSLT